MEKNQYNLCLEVFRRLHAKGMLDGLVLIGSWCLLFYRDYFGAENYRAAIRTRDLDFLIPIPQRFSASVDLYDLLSDLGFVVNFKGEGGWITFQHPDLILVRQVPVPGSLLCGDLEKSFVRPNYCRQREGLIPVLCLNRREK